ncbi:100_t:CDS:2, partial [Dentiscutata erythropus]
AINPNITSFDPNVYTSFTIDSSDTTTQNEGFLSLGTSQNTSPNVTNVTVNTRIASPKQGNAYFTDSFLVLPQQSISPIALNVDNFDVYLANMSSNQPINVHTTTGNIFMRNLNISNANLYSEKASIHGRIFLSNTIIVNQTSDGEVDLFINIVPNATNPKIYINANNGHVRLILNKTFAGTYNVITSGKVMFSESRRKPISLPAQGTYGNGTALLEVISNSNVRIGF